MLGQAGRDFHLSGSRSCHDLFQSFRCAAVSGAASTPQRGENGPKAKAMSDFSVGWLSLTVKK